MLQEDPHIVGSLSGIGWGWGVPESQQTPVWALETNGSPYKLEQPGPAVLSAPRLAPRIEVTVQAVSYSFIHMLCLALLSQRSH